MSENENDARKREEKARSPLSAGIRKAREQAHESSAKEMTLIARPAAEPLPRGPPAVHDPPVLHAPTSHPVPAAPMEKDPQTDRLLKEIKRVRSAMPAASGPEQRRQRDKKRRTLDHEKIEREIEAHLARVQANASHLGLDPARAITDVPPLPRPDIQQVEFNPVQEGVSYVRILFDPITSLYLYEVLEPRLSPAETDTLELIRDTLVRTMEGRAAFEDENWETYLLDAVDHVILDHNIPVDRVSRRRIQHYVVRDFLGFGPIDILMRDPLIEDISCDGPAIPVFLFHRQYESIKTNVVFPDEYALDAFVIRLAQRSGKQISIADPLLDATLPDKSRLQASLSKEITTRGSTFTIRKFRADPLTPPDLVRLGTMSPQLAAFFWFAMEHGSSILIGGGTASGKTSTLNAVSCFIPPQKKIVSIEDTREINLSHENWIPGLTRTAFGGDSGAGTIDMYKLLESALRQRPEYLIVGEVRGAEALTLFQAMATGHATYSTVHADSVQSAVYRLENPPINVPRIMLQTLGAVSIQASTRVNNRLVRRVKEVVEIVGIDPDTKDLLTNTVFERDGATDQIQFLGKSHILERIGERRNLTAEQIEQKWEQRTRVIEWMVRKGIRKIGDVVNVVSAYYSNPEALLQRIQESDAATGGAPPAP
ncbi:MAG: type II/IV secretion system ATPase subunit [Euryarchaeota archaeon]|nr:type II/IV secretion system ATPase subunit [Euryarchaeota archaeon]